MKRRRRLNFPLALDFISAPKTQGVALGYPVAAFQASGWHHHSRIRKTNHETHETRN
jgi:hypothetical protein